MFVCLQVLNAATSTLNYFPQHAYSIDGSTFIDASVALTNASATAIRTAVALHPDTELRILSIGAVDAAAGLPAAINYASALEAEDTTSQQLVSSVKMRDAKCTYLRINGAVPANVAATDEPSHLFTLKAVGQAWLTQEVTTQLAEFFNKPF